MSVGRERRLVQLHALRRAVAGREQGVFRMDAVSDGRALHGMPEQEAVIGRLGQGSMDGAATIEQAGFMGAAEARAPGQGRIAKRAAQQVMQLVRSEEHTSEL